VLKFYSPYEFKGNTVEMLKGQTMQEFKWELGVTSATDCYVSQNTFFDFRLRP
jgi:hypothetical protein